MAAAGQPTKSELVRALAGLGGRFSSELGIELDRGPEEVERWALAATLFGARISAAIAMRTYTGLRFAGAATAASGACSRARRAMPSWRRSSRSCPAGAR